MFGRIKQQVLAAVYYCLFWLRNKDLFILPKLFLDYFDGVSFFFAWMLFYISENCSLVVHLYSISCLGNCVVFFFGNSLSFLFLVVIVHTFVIIVNLPL